jgi:hypothetical protein
MNPISDSSGNSKILQFILIFRISPFHVDASPQPCQQQDLITFCVHSEQRFDNEIFFCFTSFRFPNIPQKAQQEMVFWNIGMSNELQAIPPKNK